MWHVAKGRAMGYLKAFYVVRLSTKQIKAGSQAIIQFRKPVLAEMRTTEPSGICFILVIHLLANVILWFVCSGSVCNSLGKEYLFSC